MYHPPTSVSVDAKSVPSVPASLYTLIITSATPLASESKTYPSIAGSAGLSWVKSACTYCSGKTVTVVEPSTLSGFFLALTSLMSLTLYDSPGGTSTK